MIYLINGKYYVKISPLTYSEIKLELKGEDLNLVPIGNKIEVNSDIKIKEIVFRDEKDDLKKQLKKSSEAKTSAAVSKKNRWW